MINDSQLSKININLFVKDIWAGSYNTVARAEDDQMMVMGLNNYAQLALPTSKALTFFMPQLSKKMTELAWNCVAIGQHHVIGVEQSGQVSHIGSVIVEAYLS